MPDSPGPNSRRDFLTGKSLRDELQAATNQLATECVIEPAAALPVGGTIRLGKPAMACDFEVIFNAGPGAPLSAASAALDLVDQLEDQMTVYRPHGELAQLNARAAVGPVPVERRLFDLLRLAARLAEETGGAFDPTAGPLVALWRIARQAGRLPTVDELALARALVGWRNLDFDEPVCSVRFLRKGVELNLGSIGKGYALDRAAELLDSAGAADWMLHGGHSSVLARGAHAGGAGWPVGIRNPLFPEQRLATLRLKDRGMSTSGSGVQFFRHGGRRYGHILDPRTGQPVEEMLSVVVLAPTAALADALSTAFFVIGVEKAREYCHNHKDVTAVLIPSPQSGRRLAPVNCGIPPEDITFVPEALVTPENTGAFDLA